MRNQDSRNEVAQYLEGDQQEKAKPPRFDNDLKVYIKNLPCDRNYVDDVKQLFSNYGRVIYDRFFEKKLGKVVVPQGFLVFSSADEAVAATKVNGSELGGRHLIVARHHQYAQPGCNTVNIKNVPTDADDEDLWQFFEDCGNINYIHINRLVNAKSLVAEVHFNKKSQAEKAMLKNGKTLKGHEITVERGIDEKCPETPVYVNGLPNDVTKEMLISFFDECGPIKRIKINSKHEDGAHAVVFFVDKESAENALTCNGNPMGDCLLNVSVCEEGVLQAKLRNPVFLAGISRETKDVDIFLTFQYCGLIHNIYFVPSKPGSLKKAFIEFQDAESITKAVEMDGTELMGTKLRVSTSRKVWAEVIKKDDKPNTSKRRGYVATSVETPEDEETQEIPTKTKKKKNKKWKQDLDTLDDLRD